MTKDNPMEVDRDEDLHDAIKDFYALRGYTPHEIYVDEQSFKKIFPFTSSRMGSAKFWTVVGSVDIIVAQDKAQLPFNYGGYGNYDNTPATKKKCCDKPSIIVNEAMGKKFYVCKSCKKETDKDGFTV